jgi:hypothetical protein
MNTNKQAKRSEYELLQEEHREYLQRYFYHADPGIRLVYRQAFNVRVLRDAPIVDLKFDIAQRCKEVNLTGLEPVPPIPDTILAEFNRDPEPEEPLYTYEYLVANKLI